MKGIRIDDNPDTLTDRTESHDWGGSNEGPRQGVSVCETFSDLVEYFSAPMRPGQDGGRVEPWHVHDSELVIVEGEESPDNDHDHDHPGSPYLLTDVTVVERRELTVDEVRRLVWGGREPSGCSDMLQRLEEMSQCYDRGDVEQSFGLGRNDSYDLGLLLPNPSDSYVVYEDGNDVIIWHDGVGEYQIVDRMEIA